MKTPIKTDAEKLDEALLTLNSNKDTWANLAVEKRLELLRAMRETCYETGEQWVKLAATHKKIPPQSPLIGEEWISGPWALLSCIDQLIATFSNWTDRSDLDKLPTRTLDNQQTCVRVFPSSTFDRLLFSGVSADVWMKPGIGTDQLKANTATRHRQAPQARKGNVSVVLGAGNIASIAPLDCIHKLFTELSLPILKLNPVNDYLVDVLRLAMKPLIDDGFLYITKGGVEMGEFLCNHDLVDDIHITGSGASHDAIIFGQGKEGVENKKNNRPKNPRRITSELGAVCPTIVVPGPWTEKDLAFQAENIATQKLHNSGFNCVASQVLVVSDTWNLFPEFETAVSTALKQTPQRPLYYPGAQKRLDSYASLYHKADTLTAAEGKTTRLLIRLNEYDKDICHYAEKTEAFTPLLCEMTIPENDPKVFLKQAVEYCNRDLFGTLGANIIIHPKTRKAMGKEFDSLLAELKYGCTAINTWTGLGFLLTQTPWGAFPGHTADDIQSGVGVVHNTLLLENTERTIIEAPFRPFPRNLLHGGLTLLPKPAWFVTNKNSLKIAQKLFDFQYKPSWLKLPGIFWHALRG